MAGISKKIPGNRSFFSIVVFLLFIGCFTPPCYADEKEGIKLGCSILVGFNAKSDPDFTQLALLPRAGWALHERWDFELEGNLSYYSIRGEKNLYLLGVNGNFLFKPVQWGKITPFLIAGGGLAYNNNNGSVREMGDSHTAGILQGGGGILYDTGKGFLLRGEYRIHHISDPFERDYGLNTHSFVLGVIF